MRTINSTVFRKAAFAGTSGLVATAFVAVATLMVASQPARTQPAYAQRTGLECAYCHQNPKGGGALTAFGNKFLTAGLKLPRGYKPKK